MITDLRVGDHIEKSELDTEQKYNDVVEVFKSHRFEILGENCDKAHKSSSVFVVAGCNLMIATNEANSTLKRKLTYNDIMSLKKDKEIIKANVDAIVKPYNTPNIHPSLLDDSSDQVKSPSHYQLIDGVESIEIIARSMTVEQWKGFCLGNMLKYRIRAGKKDSLQQDIDKANFYGELYEMHLDKCYN